MMKIEFDIQFIKTRRQKFTQSKKKCKVHKKNKMTNKVLQPYNICSLQNILLQQRHTKKLKNKKTLFSKNTSMDRKNFARNLQNKHATTSIRKKQQEK